MNHHSNLVHKFLIFIFVAACFNAEAQQSKPSLIFDSDMGPDYDDVGAITLLHAFADSGEVNILATMTSTKYEGVACVMNVLNTYFGRPGIPIGVPTGKALTLKDWQHWTDTLIANYPHAIKSNSEVWDAVKLYRKILAGQPDHSVTIVTTGFLTNLSNLLQSGPDSFSKLSGVELVKRKVKKLFCMAGKFPAGSEFNVNQDPGASQKVFSDWPTEIILSGFEIGQKIKTGIPLIQNESIRHSPIKDVFSISIHKSAEDSAGRMSWDETAVLVAIKGVEPFYTLSYGRMEVNADGSDQWKDEGKSQAHLVEAVPPAVVEAYINKVMMHQPGKN